MLNLTSKHGILASWADTDLLLLLRLGRSSKVSLSVRAMMIRDNLRLPSQDFCIQFYPNSAPPAVSSPQPQKKSHQGQKKKRTQSPSHEQTINQDFPATSPRGFTNFAASSTPPVAVAISHMADMSTVHPQEGLAGISPDPASQIPVRGIGDSQLENPDPGSTIGDITNSPCGKIGKPPIGN